jgi:5-(carboxyamino)imidazole ribonucleotide mutase
MLKAAIVMGSDSDLGVLSAAAAVLEQFSIPFETKILSAHRTPEAALAFSASAERKGFGVIIAGAGGAAHLPGVLAAVTTLPVIGVPVNATALNGLDALLSIVQMPAGIPVATVGVNAAKNAGLLAVRILALKEKSLKAKLKVYIAGMKKEVLAKDFKLGRKGYKKYLQEMK